MGKRSPPIIGLTGGIGAGKSVAADRLQQMGAAIIDTDQLARLLTATDSPAMPEILVHFGPLVLDAHGALDRNRLRKWVFSDAAARHTLERILHPRIAEGVRQAIFAAHQAPYIVLVVPLLFEHNRYQQLLSRTLLIDCTEKTQIQRVQKRSGLATAEIKQILNAQMNRAQRIPLADDIIWNETSTEHLYGQLADLHKRYLCLSPASSQASLEQSQPG